MKQSICEKERSYVEKMNKFQLHHKFKKIGYILSLLAFALMIVKKFLDEPTWVKPVLSGILLIGMLIISLAKEKLEDEYIDSLRSQSYRIAFILVIVYSLVQPLVNFGVGLLFDESEKLQGFDYFQVLFYMLVVQLMVFWQLKRFNA
ncbi:hypothetical protein [Polaribacter sp.]|uniref:hypothetical protein n=1 Tax=Polaribacter sp. TaxID=1920175 RepID=UPI003F69C7DE